MERVTFRRGSGRNTRNVRNCFCGMNGRGGLPVPKPHDRTKTHVVISSLLTAESLYQLFVFLSAVRLICQHRSSHSLIAVRALMAAKLKFINDFR